MDLKSIIKQFLIKEDQTPEFDVGSAFDHIEKMTGRRPPLKWLLDNRIDDIRKEDMNVNGWISLSCEKVDFLIKKDLFRHLKINGNLIIDKCPNLIEIPESVEVTSASITNCENLKRIPSILIGEKTDIEFFGNTSLEDISYATINVRGANFHDCVNLKKLPDNMAASDFLDFGHCDSLEEFPKNMRVGKQLWMTPTVPIAKRFNNDVNAIKKYIKSLGGFVKKIMIEDEY